MDNSEKSEKIIFAKPTVGGFCFVVVYYDEGICLSKAIFAQSAKELNNEIAKNLSGIKRIRYDVSVFMQEGKDLRGLLPDVSVSCYKPKQSLEVRTAAQLEWLYENLIVDSEYKDEDYQKFVEMLGYNDNQNTIAIDILSDVAKYYRRLI